METQKLPLQIEHRYLNAVTYHDYWKPEFSHLIIQDEIPEQSSNSSAI